MANLESTEILKEVSKAEGALASAEMREGSNATAKLLFNNEQTAYRNLTSMKKSLTQPTEAILQKRTDITLANNKQADHSGSLGDSFVVPVTFVQKSASFNVSYKLAENNQFGYQEQLVQGLESAMQKIRGAVNAYGVAQLGALKTQVSAGTGLLTWDGTGFKYTNSAGAENVSRQASKIKSIMRKNKYAGALDVIAGQQLASDMVHNAAQGAANETNYGYQFAGVSLAEEEVIDEATLGANGFGYVLPSGMVGMTSWNEPINREGRGDADDNQGLFTTVVDNVIPGLVYDVHIKRGLANTSVTGKTFYQDVVDKYEVTAIYSFSHALISTENETPIFAFEQK